MPHQTGWESHVPTVASTTIAGDPNVDLEWPFGNLEGLDPDEIRETAYEIFFTACRSSPGFGGKNALTFYTPHEYYQGNGDGGNGSRSSQGPESPRRRVSKTPTRSSQGPESPRTPTRSSQGSPGRRVSMTPTRSSQGSESPGRRSMTPTSTIKRALGLKLLKKTHSNRVSVCATGYSNGGGGGGGSTPPSPVSRHVHSAFVPSLNPKAGSGFSTLPPPKSKRPLTPVEIVKQQLTVTEQRDERLRKALMRTLVGQMGRRSETIILPLELLRHLKPSEFNDSNEYHLWQKRQLKILKAGLLLHPSIPLDKSNSLVTRLHEIIQAGDLNPIDMSKNSDIRRTLCNIIISLAWRSADDTPADVCHWADGFPFNIHIYISLLRAIFDIKDETMVLDEVDELLELMKKTWSILGINRSIHNACFTWVLFHQYVVTNQIEPDLLSAAYTMLAEVEIDARKPEQETTTYVNVLCCVLVSMKDWVEKRLLHYHEYFNKGNVDGIENLLPLALFSEKILNEDATTTEEDTSFMDSTGDRVDHYVRSSVKNAFTKMIENENVKHTEANEGPSVALLQLAEQTEDLVAKERELFSPLLKKWYPIAAGVAAATLHECYGTVLKQYLAETIMLNNEVIGVLQRAAKLENVLVRMVVEESEDSDDGGKGIITEMVPYEVDSITSRLLRQWIHERLKKEKEFLYIIKETETWSPKSKSEPFAPSCLELIRSADEMVKDFFDIPVGITDDLILDLARGLEKIFLEYTTFVASCGSTKQSYLPTLPPLTRCNRDTRFFKLCNPCGIGTKDVHQTVAAERSRPRATTSKGTQRLYIRLNTLHYLISHLHSLDVTLTLSPRVSPIRADINNGRNHLGSSSSYFERVHASIQSACDHISEVVAYRLIFLDSKPVFYDGLYIGGVANARIEPLIKTLKRNLKLLTAIVTDRAQPLATKEVMKASFEAFLMVLLAGGSSRVFERSGHTMIEDDFESLKRVFCTGEGLIHEGVAHREAEVVEGVIMLMGQSTQQLAEDLSIAACEASGIDAMGRGKKLPMPPTTRRWNREDANTILRVLCHRNDREADQFLKKSFQLAKRK